jgi:uncharacterized protein
LIKQFILLLVLAILNAYFFNWINEAFFHLQTGEFEKMPRSELFFFTVIIAPAAETLLVQYLPNRILEKLKVENLFLLIVIPSIIFSLGHLYFWLYAVMTFFSGLILNYYFLWLKKRSEYYLYITMLFHATYNLYGFLFVV